jgi:chromosome segregation ATPase
VETDSTISATLQADMQGLTEVLTGLVEFWQGAGPAVMAGSVPIEAVKAISLTICRRAKLGMEVEDALDKIQAPQGGQASPEMQKAQQQMQDQQKALQQQAEQIAQKGQAVTDREAQLKETEADLDKQALDLKYQKQVLDMRESTENELRQLRDAAKDAQDQAQAKETMSEIENKMKDYQRLVDGAEAEWKLRNEAQAKGESKQAEKEDKSAEMLQRMEDRHKEIMEVMGKAIGAMTAPKTVIRGKDGKVAGIR